jgi:aspartyl aminopeptidase
MTMQPEQFNRRLCDFLTEATTPFHAVRAMARQLDEAGFAALPEGEAWDLVPGARYYHVRNGSSLVAFVIGTRVPPEAGVRMIGAHTDSPCLKVKPVPEKFSQGYFQLGVEVYGGALLNPWYDRDLSLAGRVTLQTRDGGLRNVLVDFRDPVAVIPSLAIHLDREANSQRSINAQTDIPPILALQQGDAKPQLRDLLKSRVQAEYPDLDIEQVLDFELSLYDTQPPAVVGLNGEFLASARLDNLLSCFAGLQALLASDGAVSALLVCNDHEEVGSLSAAGAQGPFLRSVLRRMVSDEQAYSRLVDHSLMISADNAHGIHPNYASRHDDNHGPKLNGGPVIKINANQRYASTSETAALFRQLAAQESVPVQSFVVRTDMACGSTIGPITASEVGVRTLDVGVPTFAMHSVRELAGSEDACNLWRVLARFVNRSESLVAASL